MSPLRRVCMLLATSFVVTAAACGAQPEGPLSVEAASAVEEAAPAASWLPGGDTVVSTGPRQGRLVQLANANVAFDLATAPVAAQTGLSTGMAAVPPQLLADLNAVLTAVANANAVPRLVASANGTLPQGLDANATLRVPRRAAAGYGVNVGLKNRAVSRLDANVRLTAADLDPLDARFRLRAVVAPVFNPGPGHAPSAQGYAYLGARNLDQGGAELDADGTFADQPGAPFHANGNFAFGDWRLVELTPALGSARVGDAVQLSLVAAGCSAGGHYGAAYVDEIGRYDAGGTTLVAYGPSVAGAGATVGYDLRLRAGPASFADAAADVNRVGLFVNLPANTNFVALAAPADWNCTVPPQATGRVVCDVPAPSAGDVQLARLTLRARAASPNATLLGDYGVQTARLGTLLGPARPLTVVADASMLADVATSLAEDVTQATPTTAIYAVRVHNAGPGAAVGTALQDTVGAHLAVQEWRCAAEGNAVATNSSPSAGTGRLVGAWDLAAGANVACTVLLRRDGSGINDTYGVWAATAQNVVDPDGHNDAAASFVAGTFVAARPNDGNAEVNVPNFGNDVVYPTAPAPRTLGAACRSGADCDGAICADGVCCASACAGPCTACNLLGTLGQCTALDARAPEHGDCGPYLCAAGACRTACDDDAHCRPNLRCEDHVCRPVLGRCRIDTDCGEHESCTAAFTCESRVDQDPNHPNWSLEGSGCAAGAGSGGALAPLIGLLLAAGARGRRGRRCKDAALGRMLGLAALGLLTASATGVPSPARAAAATNLSTNAFGPLGGMHDVLGAAAAPRDAAGSGVVGSYFNFARSPLRLRHLTRPPVNQDVVALQGTWDLFGGVALPCLVELDVALPVALQQNRRAPFYDASLTRQHWQLSLGDLRLTPKWTFWHHRWARLAAAVPVRLPTGRRGALVGRGDVTVTPSVLADLGATTGPRLLVNLGVALQNRRVLADVDVHHVFRWQVAGELPLQRLLRVPLAAQATAWGQVDLRHARLANDPFELLGGLAASLPSAWQVELAAGTGLSRGYGAPRWRALLGLRWQPKRIEPAPLPVSVPPLDSEVVPVADPAPADVGAAFATPIVAALDPNGDEDKDGVRNADDPCPTVAGDPNGPIPGCPTPDAAARLIHTFRLVHFTSGSAELTPGDEPALRQVREVLLALPGARLRIAGHTDNRGGRRENVRLSRARAEAARAWLLARGVAPERVVARGYGSDRPLGRDDGPRARAANRRVVFTLLPATPAAPRGRPAAQAMGAEGPRGPSGSSNAEAEEAATGATTAGGAGQKVAPSLDGGPALDAQEGDDG